MENFNEFMKDGWSYPKNNCGGSVDPEIVEQSVNKYFEKNPPSGINESQVQSIVSSYINENINDFKGEKGDPGENGAPGADGITPHIGENGNWFIGDVDTGQPAGGSGSISDLSVVNISEYDNENTADENSWGNDNVIDDTTPKLNSIIATKDVVEYKTGDTLNVDDIHVTANYTDGSSKTITGFVVDTSAINMGVSGIGNIVVSYTENDITKICSIEITISEEVTPDGPSTFTLPDWDILLYPWYFVTHDENAQSGYDYEVMCLNTKPTTYNNQISNHRYGWGGSGQVYYSSDGVNWNLYTGTLREIANVNQTNTTVEFIDGNCDAGGLYSYEDTRVETEYGIEIPNKEKVQQLGYNAFIFKGVSKTDETDIKYGVMYNKDESFNNTQIKDNGYTVTFKTSPIYRGYLKSDWVGATKSERNSLNFDADRTWTHFATVGTEV